MSHPLLAALEMRLGVGLCASYARWGASSLGGGAMVVLARSLREFPARLESVGLTSPLVTLDPPSESTNPKFSKEVGKRDSTQSLNPNAVIRNQVIGLSSWNGPAGMKLRMLRALLGMLTVSGGRGGGSVKIKADAPNLASFESARFDRCTPEVGGHCRRQNIPGY